MASPRAGKSKLVPEHEDIEVRFNSLHFDPVNPRGEPLDDEEAIRALHGVEDETQALAKHMAEHGLNPLERLGVIDHPKLPGHYVVREGNRRLAAMQLLRDHERGSTAKVRKLFLRLHESGRPIPDKLSVVRFNEQPRARVWMSVKHEGEQGGVGTLPWKPGMKARFNREGETSKTRPKNPNRQAEAMLTYAVSCGLIAAEERARIPITTITRYLPNVRTALALLNNEDLQTNANLQQFDAALRRFLLDTMPSGAAGEQPTLHSRSGATERNKYAEQLRREGLSPTTRTLPAYDPSKTPPPKPAGKSSTGARSARDPSKRKFLIDSAFVVPTRDKVLHRLVGEGKALDPDAMRFSSNYINRAIIERVVRQYAKRHGCGPAGDFSAVVTRVKAHAEALPTPPSKGIAQTLARVSDKQASYSYEVLGNGVHGGAIPASSDNKSNWDNLAEVATWLLAHLK